MSKITDRALVAFSKGGSGLIVWCSGNSIEVDVGEIGDELDDLGLGTGKDDPDHGLWVWEGYYSSHYGLDEQSWEPTTVDWRQPTAEEWTAIRAQESPWPIINKAYAGEIDAQPGNPDA